LSNRCYWYTFPCLVFEVHK